MSQNEDCRELSSWVWIGPISEVKFCVNKDEAALSKCITQHAQWDLNEIEKYALGVQNMSH